MGLPKDLLPSPQAPNPGPSEQALRPPSPYTPEPIISKISGVLWLELDPSITCVVVLQFLSGDTPGRTVLNRM